MSVCTGLMLQDLEMFWSRKEVGLHDEAIHEADRRGVHFRLQFPEQKVADVLIIQRSLLKIFKMLIEILPIVKIWPERNRFIKT